jgi:hypothetical protein
MEGGGWEGGGGAAWATDGGNLISGGWRLGRGRGRAAEKTSQPSSLARVEENWTRANWFLE